MLGLDTGISYAFGARITQEGISVPMGLSLTDTLAHHFAPLSPARRRQFLVTLIAGGVGTVFGTPVAVAISRVGFYHGKRLHCQVLLLTFLASFLGNFTCQACGVVHPSQRLIPETVFFGGYLFLEGRSSFVRQSR